MSAIPSTLQYAPAPNAARGEQIQAAMLPTNASRFRGGSTAVFEFPCGQSGMYLVNPLSYLQGRFVNISAAAQPTQIPAGGASSLVQEIRVYCGSELLSRTSEYASVRKMFRDLQQGRDQTRTGTSLLEAGDPDDSRLGVDLPLVGGANQPVNFAIPLFDPTVGVQGKNFPLGLVHSLRLEIQFVAPLDGMVEPAPGGGAANSTDFEIRELQFRAQLIQLPAESEKIVAASSGGAERSWNCTQHAVYTDQLPVHGAANTRVDLTIPARFSSVKALYGFLTRTSAKGDINHQNTSRCKQNMTSYHYNFNGRKMPQREIDCTGNAAPAFSEVMRALHSLSSLQSHTDIDSASYNADDVQDGSGSFCFGTETEWASHRGDALYSGISTLAVAPRFSAQLQCASACQVTHVVAHDTVYSIRNGQCSVST